MNPFWNVMLLLSLLIPAIKPPLTKVRVWPPRSKTSEEPAVPDAMPKFNVTPGEQNALVAYRERQAQVVSLSQQVDASRHAADLAHIRYKEGHIDFLRVLDAERTRLEAEDALTQAQTNANLDVVAIYKALGGDVEAPPRAVASNGRAG